jgi:GntR family transcriptional regulator
MTTKESWPLDMTGGAIFRQIAADVRRMLARGDLAPGQKLPSSRDLAVELGVNPNTVAHAFGELERTEVIETRRGLGTFVREDAPVAQMRRELLDAAASAFATEAGALGVTEQEALRALEEAWNARKS